MQKWIGFGLVALAVIAVVILMTQLPSADGGSIANRTLIISAALAVLVGMLSLAGLGYKLAGIQNEDDAFALPSGSIRAVLALLITGAFIILAFPEITQNSSQSPATGTNKKGSLLTLFDTSAYADAAPGASGQTGKTETAGNGQQSGNGDNQPKKTSDTAEPKSVLQLIGTLMTTIVGFYFGSKSATDAATKAIKATQGK